MARSTASVLVALALGIGTLGAQAQKVGHVDKQQLLLQMPQRAGIEEQIRTKARELEQRITAMNQELETAYVKAQEELATMTPEQKTATEQQLSQMAERIDAARTKAGEDLEKMQDELVTPLLDQIDKAIADVAASGGFLYVLDLGSGAVLYHDGGTDLAPLVKAKLGIATP